MAKDGKGKKAKLHFDLVIIGSGPAGESAAMNAAKNKRSVAMVCDKASAGGNCTHLGTIPSKALRHSVMQIMRLTYNRVFQDLADVKKHTFEDVIKHSYRVIGEQTRVRENKYERNNVPIFYGTGRFLDKNTVEVTHNKEITLLSADYIIITTGSRPYQPEDVDFTHPLVFDSDSILRLEKTPKKITIIGAGVIGCEYASIFGGLGVKVELINPAETLLSFLDKEISDALSYHLRNMNVRSRHQEQFDHMEYHDDCIITHLESGKRIKSDIVLWANGRTGNTDRLNLDAVGLTPNSRGQLSVNERYQTEVPNIYAAGDVTGWPSLASAAYDQGRSASNAIVNPAEFFHVDEVPTGIYTIPEISTIGKNEEELTREKIPYEVGKAFFTQIARAEITGEEVGMLKIIFHFETLEILGIHCFGDQASEIIHIGQAIMNQKGEGNTIMYFINTTFNYPTMAEAYKTAALDGINRIF